MDRCRACGASLEGRRRPALTCSAGCRREAAPFPLAWSRALEIMSGRFKEIAELLDGSTADG
jgi:hypothetical protein